MNAESSSMQSKTQRWQGRVAANARASKTGRDSAENQDGVAAEVVLVSWLALFVICVSIIEGASHEGEPHSDVSRLMWPATVFVGASLLVLFSVALGWPSLQKFASLLLRIS